MENKKRVETRKNEIRFATSDPKQMIHKFLAKDLLRKWKEDFMDEDSGEVVAIERAEVIAHMGSLIDNSLLTEIRFFLDTNAIEEVEVSNQQREASLVVHTGFVLWCVTAQIGKKKHKFLLYANSIHTALEVAKDYIELNFNGRFQILQAKEFNNCIVLKSNLKKVEVDDEESEIEEIESPEFGKKFYQIDARVVYQDMDIVHAFIVHAVDVDTAMIFINDWVAQSIRERNERNGYKDESPEFKTTIESAVVIPCSRTIEREFSMVYAEEKNVEQD